MNGALFCVCFALLVGKESCHMLRFVLYGFALLCLWEGSCRMSPFVLFCSCGREAVTRYGLFCFAWFLKFCSCEGKTVTCYDLFCIVLFRFVLHCSALLCIVLLIYGMTKIKHATRHAKSKIKA